MEIELDEGTPSIKYLFLIKSSHIYSFFIHTNWLWPYLLYQRLNLLGTLELLTYPDLYGPNSNPLHRQHSSLDRLGFFNQGFNSV